MKYKCLGCGYEFEVEGEAEYCPRPIDAKGRQCGCLIDKIKGAEPIAEKPRRSK